MTIKNFYLDKNYTLKTEMEQYNLNGNQKNIETELLSEHVLSVYVNGSLCFELNCTPNDLVELVLGRLFLEKIIQCPEDIACLSICPDGTKAEVILNEAHSAVKESDAAIRTIEWYPEWVFQCASLFGEDTLLHKRTGSTHSCYLLTGGKLRFVAEDISRHNAMDKVVGYALKNRIPLSHSYIYTSGRVPADMMEKVIRAGIPLLISKANATAQAVALAAKYGIVLLCKANKNSFQKYG